MERRQHEEQLERARESIGRALNLLRSCPELPCADATRVDLSAALSSVCDVEVDAGNEAENYINIMNGLRNALGRMQDVCGGWPELEPATSSIARAVAVMFPLCAAPTTFDREEESPLPLVRRAPSGATESPIPLTERRSGMEPSEKDRRSVDRRDIHVELGIQSDTNFYTGFARDISAGGLFVATYDLPRIGTAVNVNFRLPGGPLLSLHGVVRWVREPDEGDSDVTPGMGISLEHLEPREKAAINAYLSTHEPLYLEG